MADVVFFVGNATLLSFGREAESPNAFEGATYGLLDAPEMKPGPQEGFGGHETKIWPQLNLR